MNQTNMLTFNKDGKLVLKKHKRELEDEFEKEDDTNDESRKRYDNDKPLMNIIKQYEEDDFILTNNNYIEKHTINRRKNDIQYTPTIPDNYTKMSLFTNSSKITLGKSKPQELSAYGTQQKYAILAKAAYFEGDTTKVNQLFNKIPILRNFKIDNSLSTKKNSVFVNTNTGEVVISYKGTNPTNIEDLYDDLEIIRGYEDQTSRFEKANELYKNVEKKYGSQNIKITGHSLGATAGLFVSEKNNVESHLFNPGIGTSKLVSNYPNNTNKSYIYKTKHDPVSVGAFLLNDKTNREIVNVPQTNTIDPHGIDNFFEPKTTKTIEDLNNSIMENPFMKDMNTIGYKAAETALIDTPVGLGYELVKGSKAIVDDIKWLGDKIIP